ncbi:Uncharacterised protein [uncultured archaeon]|nr:Uncharacterised protein [uncultured archaeon]
MPSKRKQKRKAYGEFTEGDWNAWGERFGKRMEKSASAFGEEMSDAGSRFGRHVQKEWWARTFGAIGPLITSVVGILFFAIGIVVINFVNYFLGSTFVAAVAKFLFDNIYLFFAIFVFSSYKGYLSVVHKMAYELLSPILVGVSFAIAFWSAGWVLRLINTVPKVALIGQISEFFFAEMATILLVVIVLGYVFVVAKRLVFGSRIGKEYF